MNIIKKMPELFNFKQALIYGLLATVLGLVSILGGVGTGDNTQKKNSEMLHDVKALAHTVESTSKLVMQHEKELAVTQTQLQNISQKLDEIRQDLKELKRR